MQKIPIQRSRNAAPWARAASFASLAALGAVLGACASTTSALSSLPKEMGGLPEGTPTRPATPLGYPAVHDMPPPRTSTVLTPEELKKTEAELAAARDRQPKASDGKAKSGN